MEPKAMGRRKLTVATAMVAVGIVERIAVSATVAVAVERGAVRGTVVAAVALAAEVKMKMRTDAVLVGVNTDETSFCFSLLWFLLFSNC